MNSKDTLELMKHGEEPTDLLKFLAFSYIETLTERPDQTGAGKIAEIREALDPEGRKLDPPVTIVIFRDTDYQELMRAAKAALDNTAPTKKKTKSVGEQPAPLATNTANTANTIANTSEVENDEK